MCVSSLLTLCVLSAEAWRRPQLASICILYIHTTTQRMTLIHVEIPMFAIEQPDFYLILCSSVVCARAAAAAAAAIRIYTHKRRKYDEEETEEKNIVDGQCIVN